jgi:hypothetical protein
VNTRRLASLGAACVLAIACGACGGQSDGGGGGGSITVDGGTPGGGCPASVPGASSACSSNVTCEYGGDPDGACNTVASCVRGAWVLKGPPSGTSITTCPTPAASANAACPATYAGVPVGTACTSSGLLVCGYPQGRCTCTSQVSGPPRVGGGAAWACDTPDPGCPSPRPHLGTTCGAAAQECDYGGCTLPDGLTETCTGGIWAPSATACPL